MKRDLISTVVSALFVSCLTLPVSGKAQSLSGEEQQFVKKAAAGGLAEVKLSELAIDRAADGKVKDFARQMVTDHTEANNALRPIAASSKIPWPRKTRQCGAQRKGLFRPG
jgi:predicted outer membrane protein